MASVAAGCKSRPDERRHGARRRRRYGPTKQRPVGFVTEYVTVYKVWRSRWTLHAVDPEYKDAGSILARPKTLNIWGHLKVYALNNANLDKPRTRVSNGPVAFAELRRTLLFQRHIGLQFGGEATGHHPPGAADPAPLPQQRPIASKNGTTRALDELVVYRPIGR